MLYRRFVLVVSLIAVIMGVGMANIVHATKEHLDVVREYPGLIFSKTSSCAPQQSCNLTVANASIVI